MHRGGSVGSPRRNCCASAIGAGSWAILGVLAVLALGTIISINLLFKVTSFRVETFDRTTPADTGIYTEEEIIAALGIEQGSSLFGFSTTEKTIQLQSGFHTWTTCR